MICPAVGDPGRPYLKSGDKRRSRRSHSRTPRPPLPPTGSLLCLVFNANGLRAAYHLTRHIYSLYLKKCRTEVNSENLS